MEEVEEIIVSWYKQYRKENDLREDIEIPSGLILIWLAEKKLNHVGF